MHHAALLHARADQFITECQGDTVRSSKTTNITSCLTAQPENSYDGLIDDRA